MDRVFGAVIPSEESKEPLRLNSGKLSDPVSGRARRGMVASALHHYSLEIYLNFIHHVIALTLFGPSLILSFGIMCPSYSTSSLLNVQFDILA